MRIALGVEYDGSGYCGWQTQPSGCAVQDVLDAALSRGSPRIRCRRSVPGAPMRACTRSVKWCTSIPRRGGR